MDNFGLILHWGLYSVPCFDDIKSARRRKLQNGSEWYLRRLQEDGKYRPISGWKETQEFNDGKNYEDFANDFFQVEDPKEVMDSWMKLANDVGASYVILTAQHHDGFCLWKDHSVDLVQLFKNSATAHNLRFGIYYSWFTFAKSCTIKYMREKVIPDIEDLKKYEPDIWFFDGDWEIKTQSAAKIVDSLCEELSGEINDRIGHKNLREDPNYLGFSTYRTYGDREIPKTEPNVPWESIQTIGISWGRNTQQEKQDYKSGEDLLAIYNEIVSKGGRLLLNLGPDKDGKLDKLEIKALKNFSKLRQEA